MIKYFIIQCMKKEGESHLLAPPVNCSCLDNGPIPTAPPKTSMVIKPLGQRNQKRKEKTNKKHQRKHKERQPIL